MILLVAYKHKKLAYSKRELEQHFQRLHRNPLNNIPDSKAGPVASSLEAARKKKNAAAEDIMGKLDKASSLSLDDLANVRTCVVE